MIDNEYLAKLPEGASFSFDEGLFWKKQYVGSFLPVVHNRVQAKSDGIIEDCVSFSFLFKDGFESEQPITLPLQNIKKTDWFILDQRCIVDPDCTSAGKYLAAIIQYVVSSAPVKEEYHISRLGTHIVKGEPMFCAGDRLIRSPGADKETAIRLKSLSSRLVIDTGRYSERQAATEMMKLIFLSPDVGRMVFTHMLVGLMRSLYVAAGIPPCCLLFIVGGSGYGKTTYANFITYLYDRDNGINTPPQLNASFAAAKEILSSNTDCVVILDDLFPADSGKLKRELEDMFERLVRFVGNQNSPARMKGKKISEKSPRCNAITIGEYEIGSGSEAARCLIIKMDAPVINEKLQTFQAEPLLVSTFYYYFINWYIANYDEILDMLKKWLSDFRSKVKLGVHARLQETYFVFDSAYRLFLHYCVEKSFVTPEKAQLQCCSYRDLLISLVKAQDERVKQSSASSAKNVDYLGLISALYYNKDLHLAVNISHLKEKHDGLIYNSCLCLRGTKLMEKVHKFVPKASIYRVIDSLLAQGALKIGTDKRSIQISGGHGKRFYAIQLKKLRAKD